MDGTRMGSRSSTRHGPAAVFSGPVRRWRKAWAPVSSSSSSASTSSSSSRVLLYKWVPITPPGGKDEAPEEPTPPIVRYMPVSIVLAQRKDASKRELEEVETAVQKVEDASEEPEIHAEATDLNMVSTETKDELQTSEPTAVEGQGQPADMEDGTASEDLVDNGNSPTTKEDVVMTDKDQEEETEEVEPAEQGPSGLDLESAQAPSKSSAGSEPEQ
ncbi:hypothetical protein GOP47_0013776 [Adiantum capillus-veneris]|uniref:Uncharacterized protein n=1 Tax=Adiantum capillus-veneris TaxID=13818 RepID=A0A9D4UPE7_ADICA|nr:hypothetical protein GOP47_0013776 [Adiantum capillus-veneris]